MSNPAPAALQPISSAPKEDFEIRSKEQKGLGLITLKKALLSLFEQTTSSADEGEGVTDDEKRRALAMQRQEQLESGIYESAIERWRTERDILKKSGRDPALRSATVGALMWSWHENLTSLIKEEIRMANKAEEKKNKTIQEKERCLYGPFLQLLPAEKLSAITILTIMMTFTRFRIDERGIKLNVFVGQLGSAVQDESLAETFKTSDDYDFWQNMTKAWSFQKLSSFMKRRQACGLFTKLTNRKDVAERYEESKWNASIRGRVSTILISLIIDAAKIDVVNKDSISEVKTQVTQPVFFHSYRYFKGKKLGIIRLNKAVAKILTTEPVHSVLTKGLPMLVEPKPWIGYRNGAFLKHSSTAVRNKAYDVELLRYARAASENGDMDQVFAGLNVLARTPWRINHRVFEIMVEAWNTGEKLGKIPAENPPMDYPPEPAPSEDEGIRQKWRQGLWKVQHRVSGIHSQRCFMNFQLEIARGFLNETFYFPHNIDFRGRAYPMVPYFNHMGADPNRSLLIFAKGKELGENGLKWLEIHLATLYGFDKSSFEERQKFTRDHLAEIYDSANNPLDGKRWWLQAEDPWQCLSACIELQSALNEPDPRRFISHLPIHQDGSCNGLQHYAALGGDAIGARQVNLDPGDRPSDLYSAVADSVRESVLEDAQDGNELAICLKTYINRKVVKQTVMTNVYGVTFIGAKIQVERQLEDLVTDFPDTPEINISQAALYIASKIFFALSNMFNGAQDIQRWLGDCAGRISRAVTPEQIETIQNQHDGKARPLSPYNLAPLGKKEYTKDHDLFQSVVIWTTPLKMPVVQPYRVVPPTKMQTNFQTLNLILPTLSSPTHRRKQLQAFPPNFIHSLDATHMMLTALKSDEVGITFASVHDSFWTHPADVDTMNEIIRDAFIRMHSEDIIGRLRLEFVARYKGCMQLVNVKSRGPLGNKIKVWRQENRVKGSPRKIYELLLEHRRSVLLASDKLEERLEGESMMTPGKLLQENPDETDLETSEDLDKARIGQVPPSIPETRDAGIDDPNVIEHKIQDEGVDDLDAMEFESESVTQPLSDAEETLVDVEPIAVKKGPKKSTDRTVWVWAPISFPPIPSKVFLSLWLPFLIMSKTF